MKFRLDYETEHTKWDERTELVVYKDGAEIARGSYGGEPEDNCVGRDYAWVRPVIAQIIRELGGEVENTESETTS